MNNHALSMSKSRANRTSNTSFDFQRDNDKKRTSPEPTSKVDRSNLVKRSSLLRYFGLRKETEPQPLTVQSSEMEDAATNDSQVCRSYPLCFKTNMDYSPSLLLSTRSSKNRIIQNDRNGSIKRNKIFFHNALSGR